MSNWSLFLYQLGKFVVDSKLQDGFRPSVIISVPCLDFASVLVSSGIVTGQFEDRNALAPDFQKWEGAKGSVVCFPRVKDIGGDQALYISKGIIDEFDTFKGQKRLLIKWIENSDQKFKRAVESRWLPLIWPIDSALSLERKKPGSILARHVQSLEVILGDSGLCKLVGDSHNSVCLIDTKNRVMAEVKERISLSKIGLAPESMDFVLRDLLRLDLEGGEAMSETYCCRVISEPENEWPATVMSGSLRFLKHWDYSDSPVRVAIISPTETNYMEAVTFANNLYRQRADKELRLSDEILAVKPASVDVQLMYSL